MRKMALITAGLLILAGFLSVGKEVTRKLFEEKTKLATDVDMSHFENFSAQLMAPVATPTPRPLTFEEMNSKWGPCVYLPVLMYHHVQDLDSAKLENQVNLTVGPDFFRNQMIYLRDQGYTTVGMAELAAFFDNGAALPAKAVMLTFDDGYADFATTAWPILREFSFKATEFLATGLMENRAYLNWGAVAGINGFGNVHFGNHTWSHQNVQVATDLMEKEISLAESQLKDHNLNKPKVFAYPFGLSSGYAEQFLASQGYSLAFTTGPGSILCKGLRFELPRIRIGNGNLNNYGL